MCKVISFFQKYLQTIVTLGSVIGAMIMWFVTMTNIPAKVSELEHRHQEDYARVNNKVDGLDVRLRVAEVNIEKNTTKADLTLQGVIEIRQLLLNQK